MITLNSKIFAIVLVPVVAVVLMFAFATTVLAGEKVEICHVTDSFDIPNPFTQVVGHVINVSANAVPGHMVHGDFEYAPFFDIDNGPILFGLTWRQIAENNGLKLAGVDCSGFVLDF